MTYIVMKVKPSYAILLDEDGRFLYAANLSYEVGQKVQNPMILNESMAKEEIKGDEREKRRSRVLQVIVTIAAIIGLFFVGQNIYQNNFVAHSSVYMEINPEIQMQLSKNGDVVELIGENKEGIQLLENYNLESRDRITVTQELIDRAIDMGFLENNGRVILGIDTSDEELFNKYGNELKQTIQEHTDDKMSITVEVMSEAEREQRENRPPPENSQEQAPPETSQPAPPETSQLSPPETSQPSPPETSQPAPDYSDDDWDDDGEEDDEEDDEEDNEEDDDDDEDQEDEEV